MPPAVRVGLIVSAMACLPALVHAQTPPPSQGPTFQGGVDLVTVDLTAVDSTGTPVAGLSVSDVTVLVDGASRRVASLLWLPPLVAEGEGGLAATRSLVFVVDPSSLRAGHGMQTLHAAARYLDRVPDSARVAVAVLPYLDNAVRFGESRAVLKERLLTAVGTGRRSVPLEQNSVDHINALFQSLSAIDGPKQVVLIQGSKSGDIEVPTDFAARDLLSAAMSAWRSRVIVHELEAWENPGWEAMAPENRTSSMPTWSRVAATDRILSTQTGGLSMAPVSGDAFFKRFEREQGGSYVLAFEPIDADRDGRAHEIKVKVSRPDTTIRARHEFALTPTSAENRHVGSHWEKEVWPLRHREHRGCSSTTAEHAG